MKEYHGRDVVDNNSVAVVSTESVCDDSNDKSGSNFFAAVAESARMQKSDVCCQTWTRKLSHLSAHKWQSLSNLFSEYPDIVSDTPGCTCTIVHDIYIGEAHPIKQHPYRMNISKVVQGSSR